MNLGVAGFINGFWYSSLTALVSLKKDWANYNTRFLAFSTDPVSPQVFSTWLRFVTTHPIFYPISIKFTIPLSVVPSHFWILGIKHSLTNLFQDRSYCYFYRNVIICSHTRPFSVISKDPTLSCLVLRGNSDIKKTQSEKKINRIE